MWQTAKCTGPASSISTHSQTLNTQQYIHQRSRLSRRSPARPRTAVAAVDTGLLPGLEQLVADSTLPVLKIGMVASAGAFCARQGMLGLEARRALSKLAINVFTPALMLTKLGAHTDLASALHLWYIGANVIACHLVGLGLGVLHTRLLPSTPTNLARIIQVSSAISNVGNLPLVLVLSLIKNPHLPFNSAAEAELAVSYVMLGWWYATFVQMPLGHWLLHKPPEHSEHDHNTADTSPTQQAGGQLLNPQNSMQHTADTGLPLSVQPAGGAAASPKPGSRAIWQQLQQQQQQMHSPVLQGLARWQQQQVPQTAGLPTVAAAAAGRAGVVQGPANEPLFQQHDLAQQDPLVHSSSGSSGSVATLSSRSNSSSSGLVNIPALLPLQLYLDVGAVDAAPTKTASGSSLSSVAPTRPTTGFEPNSSSCCCLRSSPSSSSSSSFVDMFASVQPPHHQQMHQEQQQDQQQHPSVQSDSLQHPQWQWSEAIGPLLQGLLSAPLIAGLVGIGIGSCPPLRDALFTPNGLLSLVGDCLDMLGQPLIPVLLLVLGANLSNGPVLENGHQLPMVNVAGVVGTQLLLMPMLGVAAVLAAQKTGLIDAAADPLSVLVMMVAWATPTAVLVHSLASVHHNGEDEVSALLFYEYITAMLTLPLCSAAYLYVLGCCVKYIA